MAINFIKNVHDKKVDAHTHHSFTRYSLGQFVKEPLTIVLSKQIKLQGGFEYVNPFVRFFASIATGVVTVNGAIPTMKDVEQTLKSAGLDVEDKQRFGKKGRLYQTTGTLSVEKLKELLEKLGDCYLLLDLSTADAKLKMKKKETPKIGSPTDKFVTLTLEKEHLGQVISEFLFDVKEEHFKKAEILHTYVIDSINVDEDLVKEDSLKARLSAIRKGSVKRVVDVDGQITESTFVLEA